jgi:hypothetical protein
LGDSAASNRLDSWKAIAEYLQRDAATVRRWEKRLGLPVHRVAGGSGRSVFAFTDEIDAWLKTSRTASPDASTAPARVHPPAAALVAIALLSLAGAGAWWARSSGVEAADLRVEVTREGITARDPEGREQWRYRFPADYAVALSPTSEAAEVTSGPSPAVYAITGYRERRSDGQAEGGELLVFDQRGELQRRFAFDDAVRFGEQRFGPPWAITAFAVEPRAPRRVALASHHWTWSPSLVTVLDAAGQRLGTFAHYGWIEQVRWLRSDRLLIGGYSNSREGGMVALVDPAALDGQGPEDAGGESHCRSCGDGRPLRMVAMPRTEVNRASASRFNRAVLEITPTTIIARTMEMAADESGVVEVIYEFTHDLQLTRAAFGERYWYAHRQLELAGKIDHPADRCPDRLGPRPIEAWTPEDGWR